jgi:ABC-type phosphate/phosphonate transport system substrate-binding protein
LIASLPMYNQADCQPATDRYWALIRDGVRAAGIAAPEALTWGLQDFLQHWQRPDLVLSQTCGFPFRAVLHKQVTLIGTPDFGVEGCAPGYYRSVLVARSEDSGKDLAAFQTKRFAYNDAMSQSGWAAAQNHAASLGFQFEKPIHSGGHALSAQAVLKGHADIASIDAVTWRFLVRNNPTLGALHVIDRTAPTPSLPYIAVFGSDRTAIFTAISAAIQNLSPVDRQILGLRDIVYIPAEAYLAVLTPASPDQYVQ